MQPIPNDAITLHALSTLIRQTVEQGLPYSYIVIAEIQSLSVNRSGHAYLDLVEKSEDGDRIIAQARATIWAGQFRMIKAYFELESSILYYGCYTLSLTVRNWAPPPFRMKPV